ncbi:hypothetical protein V502_00478 [Pseudogymnoascus sp. VKM F-4520 (FW-2644)]|nr:hypothetical protein V502_00478 [Pseudogymnoascus sp. VKM F-4520 (FW-2644)]
MPTDIARNARIRDNQRRSRANRKEHLEDFERRLILSKPPPRLQPPWGEEFPSLPAVNSNAYVHGNYRAPPPPTGRRKALLIGINYFGQLGQLKRSINDIKNISLCLCEQYELKREDTVILTDDLHGPMSQPTKQNILTAMHWLVKGARPNDLLFFCYSGHGGQTKVLDGSYDEVIYPVDFREVGHIVNHEMHRIMVTPLHPGVHLTAIVDSCHSNSDDGSFLAELLCNSQAVTRHEGIIHNIRKQKIHSQFSTEKKTFSRNDALTQYMRVVHPSHTLLDKIMVSPQQKPEALSNHVSSSYMPLLLPASAAAFALRTSSVDVVLGSKVEPWLTQTLKRINRIRRPLNSVLQHQRFLTETLSSADAIWTLTSIMLRKTPDSELHKDPNPLKEALFNFQLVHIEAYVVHVDMVLRNEVAFKLTPGSIEALTDYHKEIHCDIAASTYNWIKKDLQVKELHDKFIKAINKFVYRTNATALEGLEEEGVGELLCSKSNEVKSNIMNLFLPLLPPPLSHQTPGPDKDYEDSDSSLGQTQALNLPFPLSPSHTTTATARQPSQLRVALPSEHKCERIIPPGKRCNAIFSRSYDLTRHEDTIHNALRKEVHCQFCTKTFSRKDYLPRHIRAVHREIKAPNALLPPFSAVLIA